MLLLNKRVSVRRKPFVPVVEPPATTVVDDLTSVTPVLPASVSAIVDVPRLNSMYCLLIPARGMTFTSVVDAGKVSVVAAVGRTMIVDSSSIVLPGSVAFPAVDVANIPPTASPPRKNCGAVVSCDDPDAPSDSVTVSTVCSTVRGNKSAIVASTSANTATANVLFMLFLFLFIDNFWFYVWVPCLPCLLI